VRYLPGRFCACFLLSLGKAFCNTQRLHLASQMGGSEATIQPTSVIVSELCLEFSNARRSPAPPWPVATGWSRWSMPFGSALWRNRSRVTFVALLVCASRHITASLSGKRARKCNSSSYVFTPVRRLFALCGSIRTKSSSITTIRRRPSSSSIASVSPRPCNPTGKIQRLGGTGRYQL
jgi:hypothetical protein